MKIMRLVFIATLLSFSINLFCIRSTNAALNDSDKVRLDGFSDKKLQKLQSAIEKAADKSITAARSTSVTPSPALDEILRASTDDACDSFYMPRPNSPRAMLKTMPTSDPCLGRGTSIVALSDIQVLFLCKNGVSVADYDFAAGRAGFEKRADGDLKTPTGTYSLGLPKVSRDGFKIFIPVGYPTTEQKKNGFTGGDIGIHGPPREFRCAGFFNTVVNWTRGCLAVASDTYIKEIGRFAVQNGVKEISILPAIKTP